MEHILQKSNRTWREGQQCSEMVIVIELGKPFQGQNGFSKSSVKF